MGEGYFDKQISTPPPPIPLITVATAMGEASSPDGWAGQQAIGEAE